ncbi:MAG: hypothetical protein RIA71_16520 [Oceanicaulis sp.]
MIARLSLLPLACRRAIAASLVILGVALPVLVGAVLVASLIDRNAERRELMAETTRLHAALQARLDALGPSGPAPVRSAEIAQTALIETAAGIADQLSDAPLSVAIGAPQEALIRGVSEIRLEVMLTGAPDAVADALARLETGVEAGGAGVETGAARVFLFTLAAVDEGLVEARFVFARTIQEPGPETGQESGS